MSLASFIVVVSSGWLLLVVTVVVLVDVAIDVEAVVVEVVSAGAVTGIRLGGGVKSMSKSYNPGRNESAERVVNHGGSGLGVVLVLLEVSVKTNCQHD